MRVRCACLVLAVTILAGCELNKIGDEHEEHIASAPLRGAIDIRSFVQYAKDRGTDMEDWQPAFQKAIEAARQETRPIYVPAGEYKIRKAIVIVPVKEPKPGVGRKGIRIIGDGQYHSIISQQVETENVIDWTGLSYEEPAKFGHISHIQLGGGTIALNIKWHNYFTMDSCYIRGVKQYGIYAEGWSSRFLNSTIRWCFGAGIRAGAHFNNNVIRDCYFSRDGVGFYLTGAHGSRIEGCGFEVCAKAAIFMRGATSFTINNSYFEGNGYKKQHRDLFNVEGTANTIHLDYACRQVAIHDNIFRHNTDEEGALVSVAYCISGHIYDNMFYNTTNAIKLRSRCETNQKAKDTIVRLIVENNLFMNATNVLLEEEAGLIERAVGRGCAFRVATRRACEGNPNGKERPECIGDEILDVNGKKWYKSVGPTVNDWVPLQ